jgi:recombinational DNA repair protein RecT
MAASLDLPINQNLGMAYLIPYNVNKRWLIQENVPIQIGYKG